MAAQLVRKDETVPDPMEGEDTYDHFLLDRMRITGLIQQAILLRS
jgi:hypothetical protein